MLKGDYLVQYYVENDLTPTVLVIITISFIASFLHALVVLASKKMRSTRYGFLVIVLAMY